MKGPRAFAMLLAAALFGACAESPNTLREDGLQDNAALKPAATACEMCSFDDDDAYYCRKVPCQGGCLFDGAYYAVGEAFNGRSSCERCVCEDFGDIVCEPQNCRG